jgi:hypothetical protein
MQNASRVQSFSEVKQRRGVPKEVTGAWGTETPLQDLMGYIRMEATVAAGSPAGSSPPPPPLPRREERKDAAFSMDRRWVQSGRGERLLGTGVISLTTRVRPQ